MNPMPLVLSAVTTLAVLVGVPTAAAAAPPVCLGAPATIAGEGYIEGTPGDDVIVATDPGSEVHAGPGDDRVCGAFLAYGERGDDRLRFTGGRSGHLSGGPGTDRLVWVGTSQNYPELDGGPGPDRILARGSGVEILAGGDGDDLLESGPGNDYLFGQQGDDVLRGGSGGDEIGGGRGDDRLLAGAGDDNVSGDAGRDRADGGPGRDTCSGVERATSC